MGSLLSNVETLSHLDDSIELIPLRPHLIFGKGAKMGLVDKIIQQVADTDITVLIRGESGTGKELVAREIVARSSRKNKPLIKVNCAAIPSELMESELFGYEKGSFTGAIGRKSGKFEQANYGTIFLDEISEMPPSLQAKLLHVLQDKEFSRLGGDEDIEVDVRVITATNRNLEEYLHNSQFRQDLYYRINVVSIHMPALRERKDDIPELMDFFLQKYAASFNKRVPSVSKATLKSLISYTWPGNIRELENLAKKFVILENESLALTELVDPGVMAMPKPFAPGDPSNPRVSLKNVGRMAAREAERKLILGTLMETRWNRRKAAELLDISYKALLYKIKQNNIIRKISHLSSK